MALQARDKLGPYEILAPIGKGGMGEVYRASDTRLHREVAIKVAAQQFSERFDHEARVIASLNHPNICSLFDVGPDFLVMELVEGPTLAERIREDGAIPLDEALAIARQIADALEAAHEKGVVHRDLKPGNVKIKPDGTVKVLDFGLAKTGGTPAVRSDDSPTLSMGQTEAGVILGTAAYMSPEQAKGKVVDKRADIWAFGVVLYEMLSGTPAFPGETLTETLAGVMKGEPDWSRVPPQVHRMLRSCLQKDAKLRLHDIADARLLLDEPSQAAPPAPARLGRVWAAGFALAVVALAVLALIHFREQPPVPQLMRFQVPVPEGTSVGRTPGFALSPDGRYLAFLAMDTSGLRFWIRSLDNLQAHVLPDSDTNNGRAPFWSPDSRFIAFDAGGKLKKIDISGGPAQTICDVAGAVIGGSWNQDGVIVFGTTNGLMRVPAAGGTPSPVATLDRSRGEVAHTYPVFLPDGKHFLFARATGQGTGGVFAGTLDAKPQEQGTKQLFGTGFGPEYVASPGSRTGQVLFVRQGVLLAQMFDPQRLEPVGDPTPVADQVATGGGYALFSASANGHLAYRTGQSQDSQLTWFDRDGRMTGTVGEKGRYNFLALSPDASRAVVDRIDPQTGNSDLWLTDLKQNTSSRLTFDSSTQVRGAAWSPDSAHIVFLANRGEGTAIYEKTTNGAGSEELLLKGPGLQVNQWSHDGRFLIFGVSAPQTGSDLSILPMTGDRKPIPIMRTQFEETGGRISPDGKWVAYRSNESGKNEVYVQPFNPAADSATTAAGGKWMVSRGSLGMTRWRDDSKELYYLSPDGKMMAADVTGNPAFHAGPPRVLFQVPPSFLQGVFYPGTLGDVTGDGKRFLFALPVDLGTREEFTLVLNWQAALKR